MATLRELLEIYPDAVPAARRGLKAKLKEADADIASLDTFREVWSAEINKMHFKEQPQMIAWLNERSGEYLAQYETRKRRILYDLAFLDSYESGAPALEPKDGVSEEQVRRAKACSIEDILPVKRRLALCPFHDDKHASLNVFGDNHAHCFACGKHADAIDVYMAVNACDFKTAVRQLAP